MNLLLTCGLYHPSVGGAEEVCRRIAESMVERGHDVAVATARDPRRTSGELEGVRLIEFDIAGNWANGIEGDAEPYRQLLLGGGFDLTFHYAAQIWTTDLMLPLLGRLPAPAVLAPCGYSGLHNPEFARYFARLGRVLPGFAAVVHHSAHYQDAAYAADANVPRCTVIPNGVDVDGGAAAGQEFRSAYGLGNHPLVLHVGNHTGSKGHDLAIAAFRAAAPADARLAIIGDAFPGGCAEACRQTGDSRVLVLEGLPRERVLQAFAAADVFLFPSRVECAPLVILEAMAAGLPWISSAVGNVRELRGGVVCDDPDIASTLRDLLADSARRNELGAAGRAAAREHHDWRRVLDSYEDLFHRVAVGELAGDSVWGERLAHDTRLRPARERAAAGDWTAAAALHAESLEADPTRAGTRMHLLAAELRTESPPCLARMRALAHGECELAPYVPRSAMLVALLDGAAGQTDTEEIAAASSLGIPRAELDKLAACGRESATRGDDTIRSLVEQLIA